MSKDEKSLTSEVIDVCLRRGFVFPTADIYGSLSGSFCFGPVGEMIRNNIIQLWKETFIKSEENVFQISGATILPEKVFRASGHLDTFNDPLVQCTGKCKSMFRVDHLILDKTGINVDGRPLEEMVEIIKEKEIVCPKCTGLLDEPKQFNLMFKTQVGPSSGYDGYLRPETAQNIFINFRRVQHSMRAQLPFGIAQVGKAFRNEISPRNFLIRLREFEQMEIEMFVDPDEINNHPRWDEVADIEINFLTREAQEKGEGYIRITAQEAVDKGYIHNQYLAYYMVLESDFIEQLGVREDQYWFRHLLDHETAHYSQGNYDLEIQFPFGIVECIGNAYRTDYDLKKHQEYSKTKMHIVTKDGRKVVPHVIEPSMGLDRLFYAALLASYRNEGREWTWFQFPSVIVPWEVKVAPLMKKDGLAELAHNFFWSLKDEGIDAVYDQSGAIGKRYARADEIGIPYTLTVDYQSLEDSTVTIRERDTTKQSRISMESAGEVIRNLIWGVISFEDLEEVPEEEPKKKSDGSKKSKKKSEGDKKTKKKSDGSKKTKKPENKTDGPKKTDGAKKQKKSSGKN